MRLFCSPRLALPLPKLLREVPFPLLLISSRFPTVLGARVLSHAFSRAKSGGVLLTTTTTATSTTATTATTACYACCLGASFLVGWLIDRPCLRAGIRTAGWLVCMQMLLRDQQQQQRQQQSKAACKVLHRWPELQGTWLKLPHSR
jgi:hypothetical protein